MQVRFELISVVDGVRGDSKEATDVAVVRPQSLLGFGGNGAHLLVLTSPLYRDGSDANHLVVDAVSSGYSHEASRSVTSRLARAMREANRVLCDDNSRTILSQRHHLSALCAVISPKEAYFAQVGPSLILLVRGQQLQRLGETASSTLSAGCIGRDFGFDVHYSHTSLQPGDTLIISSPGLAKVTNRERLLACVELGYEDTLADRLFHVYEEAPSHADFSAIIVTLKTNSRQKRNQREMKRTPPRGDVDANGPTTLPSRTNLPAQAERLVFENEPELPRRAMPQRSQKTAPTRVADPSLPIRDVVIEFKGSWAKGSSGMRAASRPNIDPIGDRAVVAAHKSVSRLIDGLALVKRTALALLMLLAAIGVISAVGILLVRGNPVVEPPQPGRPVLADALQLEQDALASKDPSLQRRLLMQAEKMASSAAAERQDDREAASASNRIKDELDKLNAVTRLPNAGVLVDLSTQVTSGDNLSMQIVGIDLYVLDRGGDRLYKYLLDGTGTRVQTSGNSIVIRKGDTYGGAVVGDLVSMAWIPSGGARSRGVLVALDSSGTAFEYDPAKGITPARLPSMQDAGDPLAGPVTIAGYAGNLYLLNPLKGKLLWYPPSPTGYGNTAYNYLNPETTVDVSTAVDFVLDGSLYLLHRNGRVQKFFAGRPQPFEVLLPDVPMKAPTSLFSSQTSRYVYVVDAGNSRVVQLSKEGAFERQLRYGGPDDVLRGAKGIFVDDGRSALYLLSEKKVLSLSLGAKQP